MPAGPQNFKKLLKHYSEAIIFDITISL